MHCNLHFAWCPPPLSQPWSIQDIQFLSFPDRLHNILIPPEHTNDADHQRNLYIVIRDNVSFHRAAPVQNWFADHAQEMVGGSDICICCLMDNGFSHVLLGGDPGEDPGHASYYVTQLAWKRPRTTQGALENVSAEWEVWTSLLKLLLMQTK